MLLVLVAVLLGMIVALATGLLTRAGGAPLSAAIITSGLGFGGTVSVALLIEQALGLV
jgi:hypothetical protein